MAKDNEISESVDSVIKTSTVESTIASSFFYTSDKLINTMDNDEILQKLEDKFPGLNVKNTDIMIKKSIVQLIDDIQFVQNILGYYNITIYDLFTILYKQYAGIFKGPYLKKLRNALFDKPYAISQRRKN